MNINNQFTLETDSGYFIARDINGPVYIWGNLIDAHEDLKIMGCDGVKVIFIAEKLLTK